MFPHFAAHVLSSFSPFLYPSITTFALSFHHFLLYSQAASRPATLLLPSLASVLCCNCNINSAFPWAAKKTLR